MYSHIHQHIIPFKSPINRYFISRFLDNKAHGIQTKFDRGAFLQGNDAAWLS